MFWCFYCLIFEKREEGKKERRKERRKEREILVIRKSKLFLYFLKDRIRKV